MFAQGEEACTYPNFSSSKKYIPKIKYEIPCPLADDNHTPRERWGDDPNYYQDQDVPFSAYCLCPFSNVVGLYFARTGNLAYVADELRQLLIFLC